MIQTIYSKQLFNGGCMFVKFNTETKYFTIGNTTGTAVPDYNCDMAVNDVTIKELKRIGKILELRLGYKEYIVKWADNFDTYADIRKAGL